MSILLASLTALAWLVAGVFIADFLTGLMHWAEDTWLVPGRSAFFDRYIVNDNIEHHRRPGSIRTGTYLQTNGVTISLSLVVLIALIAFGVHAWQPYVIALLLSHSNQVHRWSHSANVPWVVAVLQRAGVLQTPAHHARHHKTPYGSHYCALTNAVNPVLDGIGFWRGLEWLIERTGARVARATPARGGY